MKGGSFEMLSPVAVAVAVAAVLRSVFPARHAITDVTFPPHALEGTQEHNRNILSNSFSQLMSTHC